MTLAFGIKTSTYFKYLVDLSVPGVCVCVCVCVCLCVCVSVCVFEISGVFDIWCCRSLGEPNVSINYNTNSRTITNV